MSDAKIDAEATVNGGEQKSFEDTVNEGVFKQKKCVGIGDDLAFGFLIIQNNYNYTYFPYHLITDSPVNEPGTVYIRCGSSLAIIKGRNLHNIYNSIAQHRLLWLLEGEPASRPEKENSTYIESIQLVSETRPLGGYVM